MREEEAGEKEMLVLLVMVARVEAVLEGWTAQAGFLVQRTQEEVEVVVEMEMVLIVGGALVVLVL